MKGFLTTLVVILFMATGQLYAQLNNFTISAVTTPQTCLGNGSVTFTANGNNPLATLSFAVYLLPNTTSPYTTVTALTAPNLVAGEYLIIATQSLNGQSNTAQVNATVANNTVPLVYNLAITNISCNNTGSITVNVTSGTATQYEIISGPVTVAPQASNVFSGLPEGQYGVRVHDNCGDAFVTTVQLVAQTAGPQLYVDAFYQEQPTCTTIEVRQYVVPQGGALLFPLTLEYTVYPPGGATPIVITNTVTSLSLQNDVYAELPLYYGQGYFYKVKLTDACGNTFTTGNITIYRIVSFDFNLGHDECDPVSFTATPNQAFTYPVTVSFTQAPTGFVPSDYNADYPVFDDDTQPMVYYSEGETLPFGTYTMVLTDACGRTTQRTKVVGLNNADPLVITSAGCATGMVAIGLPDKDAVILNMIAAPDAYEETLPADLLGFVNNDGVYEIPGLPPGNYTFYLKDSCGFDYTVDFTIVIAPTQITVSQMPGCEEGYGAIRLMPNDKFTQLIITAAPVGFTETLPYNATANITEDGFFAMADLPQGIYTYTYTTEDCANQNTANVLVIGYHDETSINVIPNCGSFNLYLHHTSTVIYSAQTYWLQRYDEGTATWGHPETGVPYISGTPHTLNSLPLTNDFLNLNFPYTGKFRVIKMFFTYQTGTDDFTACIKTLDEFTFTGVPQIIAIYSFPCDNGLAEVVIDAVGKDPLTYQITSKAGQNFVIDNAQSNVFAGLEAAVYNFRVIDDCNNMVNVLFDVSVLQPMEVDSDVTCTGEPGSMWLPQFGFLEYEWYKATDPGTILSTTHTLGFAPFTAADTGTYMVHIVSVTPGSCIDLLVDYTLEETITPQAGDDVMATFCGAMQQVNLNDYLSGEYHESGTWQDTGNTGQLNGSIVNTAGFDAGTYVFNYTVISCDVVDTAAITLSILGEDTFDVVLESGCVNDRFVIRIANIDEIGPAELIEWHGPNGFTQTGGTSIDITALPPGGYYAAVTNADGCTATSVSLPVTRTRCDIPKGISPDGNTLNDSFDLSHLDVVHLLIFNRYGLQVYEANEYVNEWHGQSDAGKLCAGVYYYVITLREGPQRTGWVYLQTKE